jgi:predicted ArsR family transcriptional regulator
MDAHQDAGLEQLAALADPVRRRVYAAVASRFPAPVDRDAVAEAVNISRSLAAFHLDRLGDAGLVEISYARRSGRSGPGAGRPAKFYRRAVEAIAVSLPRRRFDIATRILARAIARPEARRRVAEEARAEGTRIAAAHRAAGHEPAITDVLQEVGFQPEQQGSTIRLRNCPFDAVAVQNAEPKPVVCGMNRALIEGIVEELNADAEVRADPQPHLCCVAVDVAGDS